MKTLTMALALLAAAAFSSPAYADDGTEQFQMLQNLSELRRQIEGDQAMRDAEARGSTISRVGPDETPTLASMKQDVQQSMTSIVNRFRCLDVDVDVKENPGQTNLVVVCGDVRDGAVQNSNTHSARDLLVTSGGMP